MLNDKGIVSNRGLLSSFCSEPDGYTKISVFRYTVDLSCDQYDWINFGKGSFSC